MLRALRASQRTLLVLLASCLMLALSTPIFAAPPTLLDAPRLLGDDGQVVINPAWKIDSGDTAWMLVSSALVLMMTGPGLA
jgi:hypothetical protein